MLKVPGKYFDRLPSTFKTDSSEISDPVQIADHFAKYFTNIGPSLAKKIPHANKSHKYFLPVKLVNSIFFEPVSENEIIEICRSFRSSAAPGYDKVSMGVVKEIIDYLLLIYLLVF